MPVVNIGILAHVDAGKTSLTERILFETGVTSSIGSVDAGTTQTDTLDLERQRGITIQSAVVSFTLGELKVNLIDTPGHPDFIAEVDRALGVLDIVVLVISAVEGIQPQTRKLFRVIKGRRLPCLLFVNKIDRPGARVGDLVREIATELDARPLPLCAVTDPGTRDAVSEPLELCLAEHRDAAVEILGHDDPGILDRWVEQEGFIDQSDVQDAIREQFARGVLQPVVFGSAMTGAGARQFLDTVAGLAPAIPEADSDAELSADVFKAQRARNGELAVVCRVRNGTIAVRQIAEITRPHSDRDIEPAKVTSLMVFRDGREVRGTTASAGDIVKLGGLANARIGDWIGTPLDERIPAFEPPVFEYQVIPADANSRFDLNTSLATMADEDPLINVRLDEVDRATFVHLYGEVQREVVAATLKDRFGLDVTFGAPAVLCVERLRGPGAAAEISGETNPPFYATVGFRIRPKAGPEPVWTYTPGKAKKNFFDAAEIGGRAALAQGPHGWPVVDLDVEVTELIYLVMSVPADYRKLAALVMAEAVKDAGTVVCEPVHRFSLSAPSGCAGGCIHLVLSNRGNIETSSANDAVTTIEGTIPAACIEAVAINLPGLSRGRGFIDTRFHDYEPIEGEPPTRRRTDQNPYDRIEYLSHIKGRF